MEALFEEELSEFWRQKIDFVFYDSGPNIGPLNRVILLDCDFFIIPAAYDLFSVRALKTLGRTLFTWISDWETISELAPEGSYLLPGKPKFLGYIPQNFTVYRGGVASEPARYLGLLDKSIRTEIVEVLKSLGIVHQKSNYQLGQVKDFGGLVTASQREGVPIFSVSSGTSEQRSTARTAFKAIAEKIVGQTG